MLQQAHDTTVLYFSLYSTPVRSLTFVVLYEMYGTVLRIGLAPGLSGCSTCFILLCRLPFVADVSRPHLQSIRHDREKRANCSITRQTVITFASLSINLIRAAQ